jgi:hypothetical protein
MLLASESLADRTCIIYIEERYATEVWLRLVALPNVVGGKGKVEPIHALKTYRGSGGGDPLILKLGTRWRWMVFLTPRPFTP